MPHLIRVCLALVTLLALVACDPISDDPPADADPTASPPVPAPSPATEPAASESPPPETGDPVLEHTDVATGLEAPWAVAFAPDGTTYVTERDSGRVSTVDDGGAVEEVATVDVDPAGEGGLLGIAVSPTHEDDGLVYVYRSTSGANQVLRFVPGEEPEVVLDGIPHSQIHNGGRIAFGPDDMLYVGTGDAGQPERAQDPDSLAGKILRVTPDGDVPEDNPTAGSPVYALGLRNPQGMAWAADGTMYASEFGPDRDDEINLVTAGGNYGWPEVTGVAERDGFEDPIFVQQPADASWTGMAVLVDSAIPQWEGQLMAAALRGERLWRVPPDDPDAAEPLFEGEFGRLRTAVQAPDGSLWVLTNNRDGRGAPGEDDDRIIRVAPAG